MNKGASVRTGGLLLILLFCCAPSQGMAQQRLRLPEPHLRVLLSKQYAIGSQPLSCVAEALLAEIHSMFPSESEFRGFFPIDPPNGLAYFVELLNVGNAVRENLRFIITIPQPGTRPSSLVNHNTFFGLVQKSADDLLPLTLSESSSRLTVSAGAAPGSGPISLPEVYGYRYFGNTLAKDGLGTAVLKREKIVIPTQGGGVDFRNRLADCPK